jgi:hypothetical protein
LNKFRCKKAATLGFLIRNINDKQSVEKKSGLFRPLKHGGIGGMKQAVHHDGEDA